MTRENFKKIIRLRSFWKIDSRKGNYKLPNGEKLSVYVEELFRGQLKLDSLAIGKDKNLYHAWNDGKGNKVIFNEFKDDEICSLEEQAERIEHLVSYIIY